MIFTPKSVLRLFFLTSGQLFISLVLPKRRVPGSKESFTPSNTTPLIPVLLVGSVHPDELTVYLRMFTQLTAAHINVHMILVPRHLHWVDSLQAQVNATTQNSFHLNGHEADSRAGTLASVQDHLDIPGISTVSIVGVLYDLYQYATIFIWERHLINEVGIMCLSQLSGSYPFLQALLH